LTTQTWELEVQWSQGVRCRNMIIVVKLHYMFENQFAGIGIVKKTKGPYILDVYNLIFKISL
jgi:hypothetical protein